MVVFFLKENVIVQNTFLDVQFHLPIPVQIVTMTKLWAYIAMPECHELRSEPGLPSIRPRENDLFIFEVQLLPE